MSIKFDITAFKNIPEDLVEINTLATQKKVDFVTRQINLNGIIFTLVDTKLHSYGGDEDKIYRDDRIRLLIPRGLCFIFADNVWVYTLYGHPKFGNYGDYISSSNKIEHTTKIFRSKENGECAHWGAFELNGVIYEVYGSKNVHMIVRSNNVMEDLENQAYKEQRYGYSTKMAILINKQYKEAAIQFLVKSRDTLCGEGCFTDSQHFVKYTESIIFFFAVTGKRSNLSDSIVKISPREIDSFIVSLGLIPVRETIIVSSTEQMSAVENHFELLENSEGAVVSCVDNDGNVVYMYKHKNFDYVFRRALREQMKNKALTPRILKRFDELHIVHPNFKGMVEWALKFNAFYKQGITDTEREHFFDNWVTWEEVFSKLSESEMEHFVVVNNECERIEMEKLEVEKMEQERIELELIRKASNKKQINFVICIGPPGSGKSSMGRILKGALELHGLVVRHLEQDMFNGNNKTYQKEIEKAIANDSVDYLILTKSNHNHHVRNDTYSTLSKCKRKSSRTYILLTSGNEDMTATENICVERVMKRGNAHATLYGKSEAEIRGIIRNFTKSWETLNSDELKHPVVRLEINQPKEFVVQSLFQQLSMIPSFGNFVNVSPEQLVTIYAAVDADDSKIAQKTTKK